jgi:hypothetical protein
VNHAGELIRNGTSVLRRLLLLIAPQATQLLAQVCCPSFFGHHPGPQLPWRPMPHMLPMTALEVGNPVAVLIRMEPYNCPFCHVVY